MTRLAPFATSNRSDQHSPDPKLQTHINTSNNVVLCKGAGAVGRVTLQFL